MTHMEIKTSSAVSEVFAWFSTQVYLNGGILDVVAEGEVVKARSVEAEAHPADHFPFWVKTKHYSMYLTKLTHLQSSTHFTKY